VDDALKYKKTVVDFRVGALEEMIGDQGILVGKISHEALAGAVVKEVSKQRHL